jgi:Cu+-exporting ATPase
VATVAEPRATEREQTSLALEGMTCASCATRIERSLNKLDGVEATVNFATENATVSYDPDRVLSEQLLGAVEAIGYHAAAAGEQHTGHEHERRYQQPALAAVPQR